MAEITDYKKWLSDVHLEGHEEVYNLYTSVSNFEPSGTFETTKIITNDGHQYTVKAEGNEDLLLLQSDEDKFSFLNYLASEYTDSEEGIEKWYQIKKELGRID
jgi:hypothetical protein